MAINETVISIPVELISNLIGVIVALGGVVFLYLIFSVLRFVYDRKKYKKIGEMSQKMSKIIKLLENKK